MWIKCFDLFVVVWFDLVAVWLLAVTDAYSETVKVAQHTKHVLRKNTFQHMDNYKFQIKKKLDDWIEWERERSEMRYWII